MATVSGSCRRALAQRAARQLLLTITAASKLAVAIYEEEQFGLAFARRLAVPNSPKPTPDSLPEIRKRSSHPVELPSTRSRWRPAMRIEGKGSAQLLRRSVRHRNSSRADDANVAHNEMNANRAVCPNVHSCWQSPKFPNSTRSKSTSRTPAQKRMDFLGRISWAATRWWK